MTRVLLIFVAYLSIACAAFVAAQAKAAPGERITSAEAQVDFGGFQQLAKEVYPYRAQRLVSLGQFQAMARERNTIILDARSADAYRAGHIEGAINLSLTDFTAPALAAAIRDPNTRILIYCNNNFENDVNPVVLKRVDLALNIQTFINLYGYGYRNVYELADRVNFNDPRGRWVRSAP